jgi:hypothetical protein
MMENDDTLIKNFMLANKLRTMDFHAGLSAASPNQPNGYRIYSV